MIDSDCHFRLPFYLLLFKLNISSLNLPMAPIRSIMRKVVEKVIKPIIYTNMNGTGHSQFSKNLNGIFYEY